MYLMLSTTGRTNYLMVKKPISNANNIIFLKNYDFKEWQAGQVWPHLQISLVIGTICPDEFGCVTGIPAPYKNSSGLIISTSPLLLL